MYHLDPLDTSTKGLYFCDGTGWQPIGGGGGAGYWAYNETSNALTVTNTSWGVTLGADVDVGFLDGSSLLVSSETTQGNINIAGVSDGGATWSALYLHDNTADLNNNWVIAFKKRTGFDDENDLLIQKWVSYPPAVNFNVLRIDSVTGYVGVGNTGNPTERLDVAGNIKSSGTITAANNMYALGFFYSSDASLKQNIRDLPHGLDRVLQLKGQAFEWKSDGRPDVGLIAQDVEKVFPELVATDKNTGLKSVEYGNLVAVLVEAVKELQGQVNDLKAQIQKLNVRR